MTSLGILLRIAARNLVSSSLNLLIGGIMAGGTLIVVLGAILLDSVDTSLRRSISSSVAGDLQLYSAASADDFSIWSDSADEGALAIIENYGHLKQAIASVENVRDILPMGINSSEFAPGNVLDRSLFGLRELVRAGALDEQKATPEARAALARTIAHLRHLVDQMRNEQSHALAMLDESTGAEERAALETAASDAFWAGFEQAPDPAMEFLENRVAPVMTEGDVLEVRFVGTDLEAYARIFDNLQMVQGTFVAPGEQGLMLSNVFYEGQLKLRSARRLDLIKAARADGRSVAEDEEIKQWVAENRAQTRELLLQLDGAETLLARQKLQQLLGSTDADLAALLERFFDVDDQNFDARYAFFYDAIAPLVDLYLVRVGDLMTLRAFSRAGYVRSVNVPVRGIYQLRGMEQAGFGGSLNLLDLITFRNLLGHPTPDQVAEIQQLKQEAGFTFAGWNDAEAALFGSHGANPAVPMSFEVDEAALFARKVAVEAPRRFTREDLERGVILNAALMLKDPLRAEETAARVEAAAKAAGYEVKVITGHAASGLMGQFVTLARGVLFLAAGLIFLVALVIINNAMMVAMFRRVKEIGTIRAIGGQRGFVVSMILAEITLLGVVFGGLGIGLALLIVRGLGVRGIPAPDEDFMFIFGGPALHPVMGAGHVVLGAVVVLTVGIVSTLYPALAASRIAPVTAMQSDD